MRRKSGTGTVAVTVALVLATASCTASDEDVVNSTDLTTDSGDSLHGSALAAREAVGVPTYLSDDIREEFPEALELTDRAAPGLDGFLSRTFGVEGDRDFVWSVDSERVSYDGADYEVTTVTGGPNTFASVLADEGWAFVREGGVTRTGSGGHSVEYDDLEAIYTWAMLTSVRYVYVMPVNGDTPPRRLSYVATATHTVTAWTLYDWDETGAGEASGLTQGQRQEADEPACFTPGPETVIRAYLGDDSVAPLCLAGSVEIMSVDGEVLTTIDPLAPEFPT